MATRKKILYLITQDHWGGAQRYVFDLAQGLKDDFEVVVAAGGDQGSLGLGQRLEAAGIRFYRLDHLDRSISLKDFSALAELIRLMKEIGPDIIHLNSSKISILGSLASLFYRPAKPPELIYTVHGWVFNEPLPFFKRYFYFWAEKLTAPLKDKIICVSDFDRRLALEKKIAPPERLTTIHNGLSPFALLPKKAALRELGMATDGRLILGSIANFYKTKGLEFFIGAAGKLKAAGLDFEAVIIGDGEERSYLERLIRTEGLEAEVILAGAKKEAARYLSAFDIYVSSSVKEGFSYSILEAMASGLPVVATRVGGNPEMVEDGKTGLLAAPRDSGMLAEKIREIIDKKLKDGFGAEASGRVRSEFSLEKMIERTKDLYRI